MDIRKQQVAPSSRDSEAENSTAVLQLLGVAKTLLANVRARRHHCVLNLWLSLHQLSSPNPSLSTDSALNQRRLAYTFLST